jgi:DNA-binding transcriptional MerR regulator
MRKVESLTGLTARRIRYYESLGWLGDVERSAGNQRMYESGQIQQLREIAEYRSRGFTIRQIEALLDPDTSSEVLERWAEQLDREGQAAFLRAYLFRQAAWERRRLAS